jgi:hypothetical protein
MPEQVFWRRLVYPDQLMAHIWPEPSLRNHIVTDDDECWCLPGLVPRVTPGGVLISVYHHQQDQPEASKGQDNA